MHLPTFLKCFRNHDDTSSTGKTLDSRRLHRLSWKRWRKKRKDDQEKVYCDGPHLEFLTDSDTRTEENVSDFTAFFSEPEAPTSYSTTQNTKPPLRSILRDPPPPCTDPVIEDLITRSGKRPLYPIFSRPLPSRLPLPRIGEDNLNTSVGEAEAHIEEPKAITSTPSVIFETGSCSFTREHSKEEPVGTDSQSTIAPSGSDMDVSKPIVTENGSSSQNESVVGCTTTSTPNVASPDTEKIHFAEADFTFVAEIGTVTCSASSRQTSGPSASTQDISNKKDCTLSHSALTENATAEDSSLSYESRTPECDDEADSGVVKSSSAYLEKGEIDHQDSGTSSETSRPSVPTQCIHDTDGCIPSQSTLKKRTPTEGSSLNHESANPEGDDYVGRTVQSTSTTYKENEEIDLLEHAVPDSDCQEIALENKKESKLPGEKSAHSVKRPCTPDKATNHGSEDVAEILPASSNSQNFAVTSDAGRFREDDKDVSEIQPVISSCEVVKTTASETPFLREGDDLGNVVDDDRKIDDDNKVERNTEAGKKDTEVVEQDAEAVETKAESNVQTPLQNKRKKRVRFNFSLPDPPPLGGFTLIDENGVEHTRPNMMFTFPAKPSFKETAIAMRGTRFHERCERKAVNAYDNLKRFFNSRRFKYVVRSVGPPLLLLMVGVIFLVVLL